MAQDPCLEMDCIDEERLNNYGCLKWLVLGVMITGLLLSFIATANGIRQTSTPPTDSPIAQIDRLQFESLPAQSFSLSDEGSVLTRLELSGFGTNGSVVELMRGDQTLAATEVGENGEWSFDESFQFEPGRTELNARMVNSDGVEIGQSAVFAFEAPAAADLPTPTVESTITPTEEGAPATPETVEPTPQPIAPVLQMPETAFAEMPIHITGSAAPNTEVQIVVNELVDGVANVDDAGSWEYETQLPSGEYILLARTSFPTGIDFDSTPVRIEITPPTPLEEARQAGVLHSFIDAAQATGWESEVAEGEYTLFMPSDMAIGKLPAELFTALNADPEAMKALLNHHTISGTVGLAQFVPGQTFAMLSGEEMSLVAIDRNSGFGIGKAAITSADIVADNLMIHILDRILFPPSEIGSPQIDSSGVATFSGDFLTVVGDGTPGTTLLLALNGETFGQSEVGEDGRWQIPNDISPGNYEIIAYALDDAGIVQAASDPVYLTVE